MNQCKYYKQQQRGATLIMALIVLAAMTIFGMSSMRSTSIQQSILKNTQLYRNAQIIAANETNAQIDYINDVSDTDEIIQDTLNKDIDYNIDVEKITASYGGLKSAENGYTQDVQFRRKSEPTTGSSAGGYSLGKAAIRTIIVEIESTASLDDEEDTTDVANNSRSEQIQGIEFTLPPLGT